MFPYVCIYIHIISISWRKQYNCHHGDRSVQMEIKSWVSCCLVGTFLLFSSLQQPSFSFSDHNKYPSRRLLHSKLHKTKNIQQFLTPHNILRAQLGLPPLRWSKKLANFASWWANQRRDDCKLTHSRREYGENLFWGSGKNWEPRNAVAEWAKEKRYYSYKTNTCTHHRDCLHYTQIIWRQSSEVGCARVVCKSGDTFITCNYFPHGNVIGQKPFWNIIYYIILK